MNYILLFLYLTEWDSKNPLSEAPMTKTFVAFRAIRVEASVQVSKYSRFTNPHDLSTPVESCTVKRFIKHAIFQDN
jgi:TATA-binding protein-associated factor Taf7